MGEKLLMKGNEALAEAAIRAGCKLFFGYPITPQTELAEYMAKQLPKRDGLCLQAESEVSAINMIYGAAASGARCITSTSSPGVSLMSEGISYIIGADLPCVLVNVQRGGPGLGGIQPAQSDYNQAVRGLGHGDQHVIVLAPASVQEMASLTGEAFDLADLYRMPCMILADGALGQMMEPVDFEARTPRELPPKDWATNGHRGVRRHTVVNSLYIEPEVLEQTVVDRFARYARIEENEVQCEHFLTEDADVIVVSYGITARIAKTAVRMAREKGIKAGLFRPITLWPFPNKELKGLAKTAKAFLSVEMNMGQMVGDVRLAVDCSRPVTHYGRTGGMIPTPEEILAQIARICKEGNGDLT